MSRVLVSKLLKNPMTWAALVALETACTTAQAALDVTTTDGVSDYMALTRVRYHARQAFPDPDFLQAALS